MRAQLLPQSSKKKTSTLKLWIVLIAIVMAKSAVMANGYTGTTFLGFDPCTGRTCVQIGIYNQFSSGDDDWLGDAHIYYKNTSGNWVEMLHVYGGSGFAGWSPGCCCGNDCDAGYSASSSIFGSIKNGGDQPADSPDYGYDVTAGWVTDGNSSPSCHLKIYFNRLPGDIQISSTGSFDLKANGTWQNQHGQGDATDNWGDDLGTSSIISIASPYSLTASTDQCNNINLNWAIPSQTWQSSTTCGNYGTYNYAVYCNGNFIGNAGNSGSYSISSGTTLGGITFQNGSSTSYSFTVKTQWTPYQNNDYGSIYSPASVSASGTFKAPPVQVVNPKASNDQCDGSIIVSWDWFASSPNGFVIERSTSSGSGYSVIANLTGTDRTYTDAGRTRGTTYYYHIYAQNDCPFNSAKSLVSGISPIDPALPTNLVMKVDSINNTLRVSWKDNANNETKYAIQRISAQGGSSMIDVSANDTAYVDDQVVTCTTYKYFVWVYSDCQTSGLKSATSVSGVLPPASLSSLFDATHKLSGSKGYFNNRVELTWTKNGTTIDAINIWRKHAGTTEDSIQIGSVSAASGLYDDMTADAGTFYKYTLVGQATCNSVIKYSNASEDIGFRSPTAIVNGNVSYAGGIAVPNVRVLLQNTSGAVGYSALFGGSSTLTVQNNSSLQTDSVVSLEAWVDAASLSSAFKLIDKSGSYGLGYDGTNFTMYATRASGTKTAKKSAAAAGVTINNYNHICGVYDGKAVKLYINGVKVDSVAATGNIIVNSNNVTLGNSFNGKMDEIRIWTASRTGSRVFTDYSRLMNGDETGLVLLYHADENNGKALYDISHKSTTYNKNDGTFGGTGYGWSTVIPSAAQLGYSGITDNAGNYSIAGIRYNGTGETFNITPALAPHVFSPSTTSLFIGDNSIVFNGIDFLDKSSFTVTGTVMDYKYSCPIKDVNLLVDQQLVVKSGNPVLTATDGSFTISVPIGSHTVSIQKQGHTFSVGSFTTDFENPVNISFLDSTRIKVIGRVVGGHTQEAKFPGKSKNNIGVARVIFKSQLNSGCATDTVFTDATTGDYVAYLPPLKYIQTVSVNTNPLVAAYFNSLPLPLLTIDTVPQIVTLTDSVFTKVGAGKVFNHIDSVQYQKRNNFVYIVAPSMTVVDFNSKKSFIGDTLFSFSDPKTHASATVNLRANPFAQGILTQAQIYDVGAKIYELYTNFSNGKKDSVPFTTGILNVVNNLSDSSYLTINLADLTSNPLYTPDTVKYLTYSFKAGHPDFSINSTDATKDFTSSMNITLVPAGTFPAINYTFNGIVIGGTPEAGQYFTQGPQIVDFVLRDPPGGGSFATREVGTQMDNETAWEWNAGSSAHTENTIAAGADFAVGLGLSTHTDIESNITIGEDISVGGGKNGSVTNTTTTTKSWQTAGTTVGGNVAAKPGALSDLYIGQSKNVTFSLIRYLKVVPDSTCSHYPGGCTNSTGAGGFGFVTTYGLGIIPGGYNTSFIFTQDYILNTEIPRLTNVRNAMFTDPNFSAQYTSKLPATDSRYGKNNDDTIFGGAASTKTPYIEEPADSTGPSYTFNSTTGKLKTDTLRFFNQQIRLWQDAIRLNEMEKVIVADASKRDSIKTAQLAALDNEYADDIAKYNRLTATATATAVAAAAVGIALKVPFIGSVTAGIALPVLYATTIATGAAASDVENNYNTYLAKKQNIHDIFDNYTQNIENITYTGGSQYSSSQSFELASSYGDNVEYSMSPTLKNHTEAKLNGSGVQLDNSLSMNYTNSHSSTTSNTTSKTIAYTLFDDLGDEFSVDVYPSIFGFGPIFKRRVGGASKCPYEGAEVTQFYKPGTITSDSTRQREQPMVKVGNNLLTNVPKTAKATFNLVVQDLNDPNVEPYAQEYVLAVDESTNPNGAIIKLANGTDNMNIELSPGQSFNTIVTVEAGPNDTILNYDSLSVQFASQCQSSSEFGEKQISTNVYVSAHFLPVCSDVTFLTPGNNWVLNNSFNDTLQAAISGYDINMSSLQNLQVEYKPSNQSTWISLEKFWKDTTGLADKTAIPISRSTPAQLYDWDVSQLSDGNYDLRMISHCKLIDGKSDVFSGVIDRINPVPFGTPSPADGILDPSDDISIQFNEPIDIGPLTYSNFDVRGVLNNTAMLHASSLYYNGTTSYANVDGGASLQNRSFTFEFWAKRASNGEQAVISQDADASMELFVGFNASDKFVLRFGSTEIATTSSVTVDGNWHHFAATYDYNAEQCLLYIDGALANGGNTNIYAKYNGAGKLYFGKEIATNSKFYNGNLQETRLWNIVKSISQINSQMSITLSANTGGLLYDWTMDEATGSYASDFIRSRNATLNNTTWQVSPNGYAAQFTASDVIKIGSGRIPVTSEMDFTLEFWFNSTQAGSATLFSNGTGNGLASDSITSWNIQKDAAGKIHVLHHKMDFVAVDTNYFDGNWHHFALVMQRTSGLSAFVDGNPANSIVADGYKEMSGAKLYVGAHGYYTGVIENINNNFVGSLDEVRLWNTARKIDQIRRDKQNRLKGDEMGLIAYMPFENYKVVAGVPILTSSYKVYSTFSIGVDSIAIPTGSITLGNINTPTIKLPRPVSSIPFTFSLNTDKIIITPTSASADIENVTLDITAKGMHDLNGNVMQSPKTWIAYINKNQVKWQDPSVSLSKQVNDPLTFSTTIVNTGGALKSYTIGNLPAWLTTTSASGSINPNSSLTITFTVDPGVNIGTYQQDVTLTTDFGYAEKYEVDLDVFAPAPNWTVNPANFQYSTGIIGQIRIDGVTSTNVNDKLAAFVNGQCRGVANVAYYPQYDKYFVVMDVYSNNNMGDTITFEVWNAAEGKEHSGVTPTLQFTADNLTGTFAAPQFFDVNDLLNRTIPLKTGWNWISVNVLSPDSNNINRLLSSLKTTSGNVLKAQAMYADYSSSNGWTGPLADITAGVKVESSYRLKVNNIDTLVFSGKQVDPTTRPVTLTPGWNWLGFVSLRNQPVGTALANLNPTSGDIVKGQSQFAIYDPTLGWAGSLVTMQPNKGYMLKSKLGGTFTYPLQGINAKVKGSSATQASTHWTVNESDYSDNMNIVAQLDCANLPADGITLGIFVGTECRGVASITSLSGTNGYFYLTAFANTSGETLTMKLYNESTSTEYLTGNTLSFVSNSLAGTLQSPLKLIPNGASTLCDIALGIQQLTNNLQQPGILVQPIPFTDQFSVNSYFAEKGKAVLRIYSIEGKEIYANEYSVLPGLNKFSFSANELNLSNGMYLLQISTDKESYKQKIVKQ